MHAGQARFVNTVVYWIAHPQLIANLIRVVHDRF